jgi:hypothetical protein
MLHKVLLGCGIASSVLYVAADVLASLRYDGYSYADQTFSELLAAGSPVRPFMIALSAIPYTVLVTAFGVGVWTSAGRKRAVRITGALLVGYAATGMVTGVLFRMNTREALVAGEGDLRNAMHPPGTVVQSLFLLLAMGVGSRLLGRRFRWYSYGTILTLLVFGALTSLQAGRMVANDPTPWMGIEERVNIYATMLWLAVAGGRWRVRGTSASRQLGKPAVAARMVPR